MTRARTRGSLLIWAGALAALAAGLVPATAGAAETGPGGVEWIFQPLAPAPGPIMALPEGIPLQFVLDDGTAEGGWGVVSGGAAKQFMWFNRFTHTGVLPIEIEEIQVLFPLVPGLAVGDAVQLAMYLDPDGDPTTGADMLYTMDTTVQVVDGSTFSSYLVDPPVRIGDPGDVLIGVVSRFVVSGVTPPVTPSAIDLDAPQGRSWVAIWSGDPPNALTLPADVLTSPIDPFIQGNWMIRAFGTELVPTAPAIALMALALVLALAARTALRRRRAG